MTTKQSTLHEGILKNIDTSNPQTGQALADLILAEANRREHLHGAVRQANWDPTWGIVILVEDAGHRQHLANAIDLPPETFSYRTGMLRGTGREGEFHGYKVTIWNLDA